MPPFLNPNKPIVDGLLTEMGVTDPEMKYRRLLSNQQMGLTSKEARFQYCVVPTANTDALVQSVLVDHGHEDLPEAYKADVLTFWSYPSERSQDWAWNWLEELEDQWAKALCRLIEIFPASEAIRGEGARFQILPIPFLRFLDRDPGLNMAKKVDREEQARRWLKVGSTPNIEPAIHVVNYPAGAPQTVKVHWLRRPFLAWVPEEVGSHVMTARSVLGSGKIFDMSFTRPGPCEVDEPEPVLVEPEEEEEEVSAIWAWLRKIFRELFSTGPGPTQPKPEPRLLPPPRTLPDAFPPEEITVTGVRQEAANKIIVDFGTSATAVYICEGRRRSYVIGEAGDVRSDVVIKKNEEVLEVGEPAYRRYIQAMQSNEPDIQYHSSLKRYLERISRLEPSKALGIVDIISQYLEKSLKLAEKGRLDRLKSLLKGDARILASVPNSFSPEAVSVVCGGIAAALTNLMVTGHPRIDPKRQVHIVREGEAVAYLRAWEFHPQDEHVMVGSERVTWKCRNADKVDGEGPGRGVRRAHNLLIIDIGAGTTDMTLVQVNWKTLDRLSCHVRMNCGVPLGGDDIDALLLGSLMSSDYDWKAAGREARFQALSGVRLDKENHGLDKYFLKKSSPETAPVEILNAEKLRILQGITDIDTGDLSTDDLADAKEIAAEVKAKMDILCKLSVAGLFEMIPELERNSLHEVILTGRGSLIPQIEKAILKEANKLGARV